MIWLTGSKGMLGTQIGKALDAAGLAFVGTDMDVDITDMDAIRGYIKDRKIEYIINSSAYTAVDRAESEEEKALRINADGAGNLARAASMLGATLIHFSTDYVFDGTASEPYKESDKTNAVSAYGRTKLAGEKQITDSCDKYFIIRISWLYGIYGNNFVKTMIRLMNEKEKLGVVSDQKGSPTYTVTLAGNIVKLISSGKKEYGIYHYNDDGIISWYVFAVKISELGQKYGIISKDTPVNPITTDQYPTPAARPAWSAFDKNKIRTVLGFNINRWEDNLEEYIRETAENEKI